MKQSLSVFFLFFSVSSALSQNNQWTWTGGDNVTGKPGIYGTKGLAEAGNTPGARSGAVQWKDGSGNFWLMGGYGNASGTIGNLNDLWMYSPVANQWTWKTGNNTPNQAGVYGIKGTADPANTPGARSTSTSVTDASGNLWLMGGYNAAYFNDFWRYSPSTGEWTWMSGDNTTNKKGVYGTKGTPDAANKPGARYSSASCVDGNGDIWLFGGYGYGAAGSDSYLNDLWKYTVSTGQWTWMSGDNSTGQVGIYGTLGTPATGNKPGARYSPGMWTDAAGNIWIFGGNGFALSSGAVGGSLNDLWMFNPSTGEWTWKSGDHAVNVQGIYGTKGTPSTSNKPGGRHAPVMWKDALGAIYLFGGAGYPASTLLSNLNDLWKFNPSTTEWTWIGGSTAGGQRGVYGVKGTSSDLNVPGARYSASNWIDNAGKLWLFGGNGFGTTAVSGYLNDFWSYKLPQIILPVQFGSFTVQKLTGKVQLNWTTVQEENSHHFSIERSSNGTTFENIGTVAASGNSSSVTNYSFTDIAPLKGINFYRLKQFDIDGGFLYSKVVSVLMEESGFDFKVLQNPVQNSLQMELQLAASLKLKLAVNDAAGNLIISKEQAFSKGNSRYSLPVDNLAKGIYYLTISAEGAGITKAFVKP